MFKQEYLISALSRFLLLMLSSFLVISAEARADDRECISGEYVVTVSSVNHLKQKTIEEMSLVSDEGIVIQGESDRALLIQQVEKSSRRSKGRSVSAESANRLCSDMRAGKRAKRRESRRAGELTIVRNISCACNALLKTSADPNDQYYAYQWGLNQANNIDIDAPEAWNRSTGTRNVVVAIIDTGVDYTHPDLNSNMWRNPGEIAGNGVDDDRNGYIDDVYGINSISDNGNPLDDQGHGTHCAGIIGSNGNNVSGTSGVNWNVSMMAVKFLGSTGSGNLYDAIQAIDYVTKMKQQYGINVVATNNSWGSQGDTWGPLGDAIMRHENAGILFVAAAGNDSLNIDVSPSTPGGFGADSVVSVAAVDANGALASFSNYGATKVDVGAPGVNILSTYKGSYSYLSGTSMATPMVTGAIALMTAVNPGLTWQNIKQMLLNTGKPLSSLNGKTVTGKMINLNQLLVAAAGVPIVTPTPSPTPTATPSPTITPTPTATATPTVTPTLVPGAWNLDGTVSGNGNILANAIVRLTTSAGTFTRVTDGAGKYSFTSILTSASITIAVEAPGYTFQQISTVLQSNRTINFAASSQSFVLSGRVIDESGSGVAGMSIDAGSLGTAVSDTQGYVRFNVPYASQYRMRNLSNSLWLINDPDRSGTVFGAVTRVWVAQPNN